MGKPTPFRASLQKELAILLLVFGALILTTMVVSTRTVVARMSGQLMDAALDQTEQQLRTFFKPVGSVVAFLGELVEVGELSADDPGHAEDVLRVAMRQLPNISSLMIADERGVETLVLRRGDGWYIRFTDPAREDGLSVVIEEDASGERTRSERALGYDACSRPWFKRATARLDSLEGNAAAADRVAWTEPYTFFTTKESGVTASAAWRGAEGRVTVVAADVLTREIEERTEELSREERGVVYVVMRDAGGKGWQTVGRPDKSVFPSIREEPELPVPPEGLGTDLGRTLRAYLEQWEEGDDDRAVRIDADGRSWWADARAVELDGGERVWIAVGVPTDVLTPWLWAQRLVVIGFVLAALVFALYRAKVLAGRFSAPIEGIVKQSERIAHLDLEEHEVVSSNVAEIERLAEAQERMRASLKNLVKLEGDLRLARQVQQQTMPEGWADCPGFEIAAWAEPADETGGDSYDVVGCNRAQDGGWDVVGSGKCEKMFLLLADATGHGIGPALSVTQLRSMLRMGIRSGERLGAMAASMNDQLSEDLVAGRFITAWLGELDSATRSLRTYSAGQGLILHYKAKSGAVESLAVDAPPLGVVAGIDPAIGEAITLAKGDVVLVMSDGIFEAMNERMEQFGQERVEQILRERAGASARALVNAIQIALIEFCGERSADDDRTAIVVRAV